MPPSKVHGDQGFRGVRVQGLVELIGVSFVGLYGLGLQVEAHDCCLRLDLGFLSEGLLAISSEFQCGPDGQMIGEALFVEEAVGEDSQVRKDIVKVPAFVVSWLASWDDSGQAKGCKLALEGSELLVEVSCDNNVLLFVAREDSLLNDKN